MIKTLILCSNEDRHCIEVGEDIYLKLKSGLSYTSDNPFVKATVTAINISEETIVPVEEKAYDPCDKKFVSIKTYGVEAQYCYTLEYDDQDLNPVGSMINIDDLEDYFCLSPEEEFLNSSSLGQDTVSGNIYYYRPDLTFDSVKTISSDSGNLISPGTDGAPFLDCDAVNSCFAGTLMTNFKVAASSGNLQTVVHNQTLSILSGTGTTTRAVDPRNIHVDVKLSTVSGNQLQIAVDGGLFVASTATGGSDTLVTITAPASSDGDLASGAERLRHTTVAGGSKDYSVGFARIRHDSACAAKGVGTGKMVRSAVINSDGTLILDAAPEHCTQAGGTVYSASYAVSSDITIAPITRDHGPTPPLLIGNGATCRAMNGLWFASFITAVACQSNGVWDHKGYVSVNEGAAVEVMNQRYGLYPGLTGTTWGRMACGVAGGAAGNTVILSASQQVITQVSSLSSSTIQFAAINLNYIGGTC